MNTQISKITTLFLNYPKMLRVWNATEFVFLSDDCVGFKVSTQVYKGTVIITWQDNAFYSVCFRDMDLKAGYGVSLINNQVRPAPYLGVGISYQILSW